MRSSGEGTLLCAEGAMDSSQQFNETTPTQH